MEGCSSHSCIIRKPRGMGTNGPCHCLDALRYNDQEKYYEVRRALSAYRAVYDAAVAIVDQRLKPCGDCHGDLERNLIDAVEALSGM